jgi:hypothetical protein
MDDFHRKLLAESDEDRQNRCSLLLFSRSFFIPCLLLIQIRNDPTSPKVPYLLWDLPHQ